MLHEFVQLRHDFNELTRPTRSQLLATSDVESFLSKYDVSVTVGGCALLDKFAESGRLDLVQLLVEKYDADLHFDNDSAFQLAAENGRLGVVKFFVENGANVHADHDFAALWSGQNGHHEVADYLAEVSVLIDKLSSLNLTFATDPRGYRAVLQRPDLWRVIASEVVANLQTVRTLLNHPVADSHSKLL